MRGLLSVGAIAIAAMAVVYTIDEGENPGGQSLAAVGMPNAIESALLADSGVPSCLDMAQGLQAEFYSDPILLRLGITPSGVAEMVEVGWDEAAKRRRCTATVALSDGSMHTVTFGVIRDVSGGGIIVPEKRAQVGTQK